MSRQFSNDHFPTTNLGATDVLPASLTLTKAQAQASPYFWVWAVRGAKVVVSKAIGSSRFFLEGVDDTDVLRKINAHEGERAAKGLGPR